MQKLLAGMLSCRTSLRQVASVVDSLGSLCQSERRQHVATFSERIARAEFESLPECFFGQDDGYDVSPCQSVQTLANICPSSSLRPDYVSGDIETGTLTSRLAYIMPLLQQPICLHS